MFLRYNKLFSSTIIRHLKHSGCPQIVNENKDLSPCIFVRNYSDDSREEPFQSINTTSLKGEFSSPPRKTDEFNTERKNYKSNLFSSSKTKKELRSDIFGTQRSFFEEEKRHDMLPEKPRLSSKVSKGSSELLRQVRNVFELVRCDTNVMEVNSILSVIKHLNLILTEGNWDENELNEFLLSQEYSFLLSGILLFHKRMDPFSLKEVLKFLEALGLSKRDSACRQVYMTYTENRNSFHQGDKELNNYFDSKETAVVPLDREITKKRGKDVNLIDQDQSIKKVTDAARNQSLTDGEMVEILSEASNIEFRNITPKFFLNYYEILERINPTHPKFKKLRLIHGHYDVIANHLLKHECYKEEFRQQLPNFFLLYAKLVASAKLNPSEKTQDFILNEIMKEEMEVDQYFTVLKALSFLNLSVPQSFQNNIIRKVMENPDVLEKSFENLDTFLQSLCYTDFKESKKLPFLKCFIKDLKILRNEDEWKKIETDRLVNIASNLKYLEICPDFLSALAYSRCRSSIKGREFVKKDQETPRTRKGSRTWKRIRARKRAQEKEKDQDNDATNSSINYSTKSCDSFNMFENLKDSEIHSIPDSEKIKILREASLTSLNNITPTFLLKYYKLLNQIRGNHPQSKEVGLNDKLYNCVTRNLLYEKEFIRQIPKFLRIYAQSVISAKEKFYKNLVDDTIEELLKDETITMEEHFSVMGALNQMRTVNTTYVQFFITNILKDSKIIEESDSNFDIFLESLAQSDFPSENKNQWPYLKSFIGDLSILNNKDLWENAELIKLIHIVKNLTFLGIYSDPLLIYVSQEINAKPVKMGDQLLVLILNQALNVLHPSFKTNLLTKETLANIEITLERQSTFIKVFVDKVKKNLELGENDGHIILTNCYTKLGVKIDLVLALNELNRLFSFHSFLERPKMFFIDDISVSLPLDYQLMFLCVFGDKECLRETKILNPLAQLKLKTFEAMGYGAVPILKSEWDSVENREKSAYFWKKITEKNSCNIPEDLIEKAREPLLVD